MSFNDFREKINANSHRVVVLDELAGQVRAAHQEVRAARQAVRMTESNALDSAIAAGVALLVIQGRVVSMKDWTAKNLREIGSSTLKLYMQLARGRDKIEAARKDAPFLSIREARQLLTTKRRSKQEPEQEEDPELTDVQLIRQLTARGLDWL